MRILNFGSLNIDHVYAVDHIVTPGETVPSKDLKLFCGGKGLNQSIALARAGVLVYHAGCIGSDGVMLKAILSENGVNTEKITVINSKSGHAIIQVDKSGQNSILLFGGANQKITDKKVDEVLESFEAGDILLLQNEINNLAYIMKKAHEKGMQIALNPSPIDEKLVNEMPLDLVTYFLLNEIEGMEITGKAAPQEILDSLLEKYPNSKVVLTLGSDGVLYKSCEKYAEHGIYNVKVADTTAAGDTFTGYFLASTIEGRTVEESLKRASMASAIAVSRNGASASIPHRQEVDSFEVEKYK